MARYLEQELTTSGQFYRISPADNDPSTDPSRAGNVRASWQIKNQGPGTVYLTVTNDTSYGEGYPITANQALNFTNVGKFYLHLSATPLSLTRVSLLMED